MPSLTRPKSTLAQMALSSKQNALKLQGLEKIQAQTAAPREIFQKSPKKQPRLKSPKKTLRQMALSSNQYALIAPRLEKIFGENSGSKSARMTKLWQFSQSHPIPAFSKKVQRGDQRKFFKNRLKRSPHLKDPEALQHKWHYPVISMHFKGKDWRRFWGKKAAPKVPDWASYGNFCKVTQNPQFLKKCKRGTQGKFSKIAQKDALA